MTDGLRPYPANRDSGVPWIGSIPEHWQVPTLRRFLRDVAVRNQPDLPLLSVVREKGVVVRDLTNADENHNYIPDNLTNYKVVHPGQFAMNKMKAWQGSYGVSAYDGIVSPAYFVFDLDGVEPEFFHSAIRSKGYVPFFAQASDGIRIGQWDLSLQRMRGIPFALPPPVEQAAIVRFLDHVDRRVRRYISAKQKLIRLVEQRKQAVIYHAVTRGLDPNVALKPSGVEWLGDVPEHWEVGRLKNLCYMKSGEGITSTSIEPVGAYPVYGGNGVRGFAARYTHDGDFILVGRQGALCGNVHVARGQFWASEHAVVTTVRRGYCLGWLAPLLRAMNLSQYSLAAAQPGLAVERVLNLQVPVPPVDEQLQIADHVSSATGRLDTAVDGVRKEVALLREYRTRLIADVVTGKLDVRDAAAQLPDEIEASEPLDEVEPEANAEEADEGDFDKVLEEAEA